MDNTITETLITEPTVSVVMPVFNGTMYLKDAIESIQNQTFQDWELFILDDGSNDRSCETAKSIALNDQRIQVVCHNPNRGLAYTMNQLVHLAHGKYIAVQEQDDFSMPQRLAKEVQILESHPEIGLVSGIAEWIDDAGNRIALFPGILARGEQFPQNRFQMVRYLYIEQSKIVNAACMFRRSIIQEFPGPFDEFARVSIDWQFFLHTAHRHLIWGIPEILVKMRRGNTHQHLTKNKNLQFQEARRCIKKIYQEYS
jgi:glycosyltransferase involved in cell wall biosynthesis